MEEGKLESRLMNTFIIISFFFLKKTIFKAFLEDLDSFIAFF